MIKGRGLQFIKEENKMATSVNPQDLDVKELEVTSAVLMGGAHHFGSYCEKQNDAFMECRIEDKDPRKCLQEGKAVTQCAIDFFTKIKGSCNEEFTKHWTCLEYNNQTFSKCVKTEKVYSQCMLDKLNIQEPKRE